MVFGDCLERSKGLRAVADMDVLREFFGESCSSVRQAGVADDLRGIDYVVTLRKETTVHVDAKLRENCAIYWRAGIPELTLEVWSKDPDGPFPTPGGRTGWTLDEGKLTDYVLFTWPPAESRLRYVVPYQMLRIAFRKNANAWMQRFKTNRHQHNRCSGILCCGECRWTSTCVFVPAPVVWHAIREDSVLRVGLACSETPANQLSLFNGQ